jgi:hypothetical protein
MMIKSLIVSVLVVCMFGYGLTKLYSAGVTAGLRGYHSQCYTIGGIIINEEDGTVVQCAPLSVVPKEELRGLTPT